VGERAVRLFVLGIWAGALLAFGLAAFAAFESLPGTDLAARIVGSLLWRIDLAGMILGTIAAGLSPTSARELSVGRAVTQRLLPLLGVGLHALSLLYVSPEIHALREAVGGSVEGLAGDDPLVTRFGRLHVLSTSLYLGAACVAVGCAVWDGLGHPQTKPRGSQKP
jgi:hypothetical protein